jgi:hypothetical protein
MKYRNKKTGVEGNLIIVKQMGDIVFPCISSNMVESDWCVLDGIVRSPRHYYQVVVVSKEEGVDVGDLVHIRGQIRTMGLAETYPLETTRKVIEFPDFNERELENIIEVLINIDNNKIPEPEENWDGISYELLKIIELNEDKGILLQWKSLVDYLEKNFHPPIKK